MKIDLLSVKKKYNIVGKCSALDEALQMALRVAPTDLSMVILGENGVGKDVFSRIIHDHSPRKNKRLMAINCGSIPPGTINSELFGHVKGAYTGADSDREGYFAACDGGTLFLDEIGELPKETQSLLLRVLESGEYIPVGSDKVFKTDVRIVAATNVNLLSAMREGKFREDLFYRLNGISINIPPLRERGDDIRLLFKKFALDMSDKYNKADPVSLDDEAMNYAMKYQWPGNIRQLRNLVESLTVTVPDGIVTVEKLKSALPDEKETMLSFNDDYKSFESERTVIFQWLAQLSTQCRQMREELNELQQYLNVTPSKSSASEGMTAKPLLSLPVPYEEVKPAEPAEKINTIDDMEKDAIIASLKRHAGARRKVAEELGIPERTLYRKIKEYGLEDVK
jgi:transcriptional regulator with PAS, ATPase and Fis domain